MMRMMILMMMMKSTDDSNFSLPKSPLLFIMGEKTDRTTLCVMNVR